MLTRPLLYLSLFLKQNRIEYNDRLSAIRTNGDWEGWLRFFLTGVAVAANDAVRRSQAQPHLPVLAVPRSVHLWGPSADVAARGHHEVTHCHPWV